MTVFLIVIRIEIPAKITNIIASGFPIIWKTTIISVMKSAFKEFIELRRFNDFSGENTIKNKQIASKKNIDVMGDLKPSASGSSPQKKERANKIPKIEIVLKIS